MTIMKPLENAKYIGYKCVICNKEIDENERQIIISLKCVQTWCGLCLLKKYPNDKYLLDYLNKKNDVIIIRNEML